MVESKQVIPISYNGIISLLMLTGIFLLSGVHDIKTDPSKIARKVA